MLAAIIVLLTAVLAIALLMNWLELGFFVGPYRLSHWASWAGTLFIAIYAPAYHVLKRARPELSTLLLDIHAFGFLLSFLLITVHFASQLSRPLQTYPELGEGIALYIVMVLLVAAGLLQRFAAAKLGSEAAIHRKPIGRCTSA